MNPFRLSRFQLLLLTLATVAGLLLGCGNATAPSTVEASLSLSVIAGPPTDSLFVYRVNSSDHWSLGPGDSLCVTFLTDPRTVEYFFVQSLYQPLRVFVWATPSLPFPHLDIHSLGGGTLYSLSHEKCS